MKYDVTVIGGGPSGLMAALSAAEHGAKTLLIEKGKKLGKKLAISGGGRCNVSNRLPQEEVIRHIPGNGKFLYSAFSIFNNYDIIDFFENLGVALKEEDHGRMFPASNKAMDVVNTLINELKRLNVTIQMSTKVHSISYGDTQHTIQLDNHTNIQTTAIVIASGGKAVPHTGSTGDGYEWAKAAGHTITKLYPTEVALTSKESFIKEKRLQGLSLRDVNLSVWNKRGKAIITHKMDMIFTHFGVSGPAVLRCSQFVVKELMRGRDSVTMHLDVIPDKPEQEILQWMKNQIKTHPKKAFKNSVKGIVPERFMEYLLVKYDVTDEQKCANISNEIINDLVYDIKHFTFEVNGSLPIEKAFVTGGGVSIKEIIPNQMQSKVMDRLFFCGEILDIHGYTGGYNITSALVTGRLAGMNAAKASITSN
ncbi:NAD(P)/FAD-dependent oxidoreductase [Oceanobacillus kimchii]|uniref:NAD(P)/FAD-dependent oxidoreductase n=1 Tax=Oceanobacillus kimchii TaxID=746691 RepID=UPI0003466677|nr:NAD(P)/FAD-dependent oxidoreductase [Oceanobacillus kimchii]